MQEPQGGDQGDEIERLRAMLQRSGPDGREERESAVVRLLSLPRSEAHAILQQELQRTEDPDGLRATILDALQRHLLGSTAAQFGGADEALRRTIVRGYLAALAPLWADPGNAVDDARSAPVRQAARRALQRVPERELDVVARALLGEAEPALQVWVLRCLADMQQTMFAATIADWLEDADETVRVAAFGALQLLTYADEPIRNKAQFEAWSTQFGAFRYLDLVERAARRGPQPLERLRRELADLRVEAARDYVTAMVVRTPAIDWPAVQARTMAPESAVLDACLEALQSRLGNGLPVEDNASARQAFCRALLERFQAVKPGGERDLVHRRALLLEVAACLCRPEEVELAKEVVAQAMQQLDVPDAEAQIAAVRSLRRFPSADTRAVLVARAHLLLGQMPGMAGLLQSVLDTLAARTPPRWTAPLPDARDKQEWLRLVEACCRSAPELDLRARALVLAQTLDAKETRVPELFDLLLALVRDQSLDTKYRQTCLIYLQAWRSDGALAERWVSVLLELLDDAEAGLRAQAAESLTRLPESADPRRVEWCRAVLAKLRDRLLLEPDAAVLGTMVECVKRCGREAPLPEVAIGAMRFVLDQLGTPVPPEQQFRVDPLLGALAEIAADPGADRGEWLSACEPLLAHGKRQSLRLILQNHVAVDLAKDVASADAGLADRARRAMRDIIAAALLKSPKESWASSESLQREARDVRTAFGALDPLPAGERLDLPAHRLLRLEVDLSSGKFAEVVQRAVGWLGAAGAPAVDAAVQVRMRTLAAEAQLALGRPDAALKLLEEQPVEVAADVAVADLTWRVAKSLAAANAPRAGELFDRVLRATSPDDPAFRVRLLDWLQHRLRNQPEERQAAIDEASRHASVFEAADCPPELRERFDSLRTGR